MTLGTSRLNALFGALALSLIPATAAHADAPISVYLNDVKIDGGEVRGLALSNVDIKFDDKGDLHIIAKGYRITAAESSAPATAAKRSTGAPAHYFIVPAQQQRTGAAQWEVDVYVNQIFVHKFRSKDPDPMFEITRFLHAGMNNLHFVARKEVGDRISTSPVDAFELVIGDGELNQGQLMLNKIASYKRTAAETGGYATDMTLDAPNL